MVNPFDQNFFKFLIGFLFILGVSFSIVYIVGNYSKPTDKQATVIQR
ncbi:MAG: hypothetical protein WCS89_04425 [Candidatus Paceibacterota bacterium]